MQASPVTYLSQSAPPFLLLHGEQDRVVSCEQSKILHQALQQAGVASSLYLVPNGDHGMAGLDQGEVSHILEMTAGFFQKYLKTDSET